MPTYTEIEFSSLTEFRRIVNQTRLNFLLFTDGPDIPEARDFELRPDEAAYLIDVRILNEECSMRLMHNDPVDLRVDPTAGPIKRVPHIRTYLGRECFLDSYYPGRDTDFQEFLTKCRDEKWISPSLWKK